VSSIATLYRMNRSAVPGLVKTAQDDDESPLGYLAEHGREQDEFGWSGYVLMYLLEYLEESGVTFGVQDYRSEVDAINVGDDLVYLVTAADRSHLPALAPDTLDLAAIRAFFAEMEYEFDELDLAVADAVGILREQITTLDDEQLVVIHIG
jgi:hypothetical protein